MRSTSTALFSEIARVGLGPSLAKKTTECFTDPRWKFRDTAFDHWLPEVQPAMPACTVSTLRSKDVATFPFWFASVLRVSAESSIAELGQLMVARRYTTTLVQIEDLVGMTLRGVNTGIRTNVRGNFFLVETGDRNFPVHVARVVYDSLNWRNGLYLPHCEGRWSSDSHLLLPNFEPEAS
jgi:hypothetical protein